jgi:predicted lysophospholipase L1 biosynthesis ABC-type transport system permease subunit
MREMVSERGRPWDGPVARAIQVVTLSLIVALFAAFAAHHAEAIFEPHADTGAQHAEIAMDTTAILGAAPPAIAVASSDNPDVLRLVVGLGCAALLLCGVLVAFIKSPALTSRASRFSGGRTARTIAVIAEVVSRIPPAPSPAQLSINRT